MRYLARASCIPQGTSVAAVSASSKIMSAIKTSTTTVDRTHTGRGSGACEESQQRAVEEVCASQAARLTSNSPTDSSITNELHALPTTTSTT